ncbi:phosphatase PAP2 family protein [Persicobacter psychrovividus]|uniref:Phosphatidic acid phosphatase type 2/haloperoxidase domain-containing protein n=1 Tax=Persicobacter psychrovividus TaxID=387638 RepID=A0ABM7VC19_9BACT|nr:hypothetical protein PEPS_07650 [Persicobacter psychrovividus]
MKELIAIFLSLMLQMTAFAQVQEDTKVYQVNRWTTGGSALVGFGTGALGFKIIREKEAITFDELRALDQQSLSPINRWVFDFDPTKTVEGQNISNTILQVSALMPLLLYIDRDIRQEWIDITLMYLQAQALANNAYSYLGPISFDRYRPLAYNNTLSLEKRSDSNNKNSFFSGHTTTTAVSSFFMAQVLIDYHPHWSVPKKAMMYGFAALPPALMSYFRFKAYKHFPTDTFTGLLIGAGIGVLIPTIHRQNKLRKLSYVPYINEHSTGVVFAYKLY